MLRYSRTHRVDGRADSHRADPHDRRPRPGHHRGPGRAVAAHRQRRRDRDRRRGCRPRCHAARRHALRRAPRGVQRLLRAGVDLHRDRGAGRPRAARDRALAPARRTGSSGACSRRAPTTSSCSRSRPTQVRFAIQKAIARRQSALTPRRRRARPARRRARPEGRHRQDADGDATSPSRSQRPGRRVAIVDLDLQFGDVALCLGLPPERTIYDLALAGGTLDREKLERVSWSRIESGVQGAPRPEPARPGERGHGRGRCARSTPRCGRHYDVVIVDTPPGFTRRGDRDDRHVDRPRHGRDARLALAQEHEARARDARADGLRPGHGHAGAQPRPQPGRHQPRATSARCSAASPTCSSRATARSRARSTRASRS